MGGDFRRGRLGLLFLLQATTVAVDDGGDDESPGAIAVVIDAVLQEGGEVLVSSDVDGIGFFDELEGLVPWSLRPAVGVHVCVEAIFWAAVEMGPSAKSGLGEDSF